MLLLYVNAFVITSSANTVPGFQQRVSGPGGRSTSGGGAHHLGLGPRTEGHSREDLLLLHHSTSHFGTGSTALKTPHNPSFTTSPQLLPTSPQAAGSHRPILSLGSHLPPAEFQASPANCSTPSYLEGLAQHMLPFLGAKQVYYYLFTIQHLQCSKMPVKRKETGTCQLIR